MGRILIQITASPYASLAAKEGLDMALVFATFEQPVDLHFSGAAVSLLIADQSPTPLHGKHLYKLIPGLEFYDIDQVLVLAEDVPDSMTSEQLAAQVTCLSRAQWQEKLAQYQQIIRF